MKVISRRGEDALATVLVGELDGGGRIECVESVQPPRRRSEKWVVIVSTLRGCPVGCPICDAGSDYRGKLSAGEILEQIDCLVRSRFGAAVPATRMMKIQFARMGDPAFNEGVLEVLEQLPSRYRSEILFPSISTVAPHGCDRFFERLLEVRERLYPDRFQMQFSLHTTDERRRAELVPVRTWSFARMAEYGVQMGAGGGRKVTLNFATPAGYPLDPAVLSRYFSPAHFAVKLTPVNPTRAVRSRGLSGAIDPGRPELSQRLVAAFEAVGYQTILSIGELAENMIGSNCGMYALEHGIPSVAGLQEARC